MLVTAMAIPYSLKRSSGEPQKVKDKNWFLVCSGLQTTAAGHFPTGAFGPPRVVHQENSINLTQMAMADEAIREKINEQRNSGPKKTKPHER